METQSTILNRHSCRQFTKQQITDEQLQTILQAANAAPVSLGNYDDVELCIIQNQEIIAKIEQTVSAIMPSMGTNPVYQAPTLILINGKKETGNTEHLPYCNASCIAENMMLMTTDLGLGSVYLYAVPLILSQIPQLCEELEIGNDFVPVVAVAIGNPKQTFPLKENQVEKIKKKLFL